MPWIVLAPVVSADDEYTVMVCRLVYLAGCFHPETNTFQGIPHPKMVDRNIWLWMQSKADFLEEEEQALLSMVAFVNRFDGSLMHRFVPMVPLGKNNVCPPYS